MLIKTWEFLWSASCMDPHFVFVQSSASTQEWKRFQLPTRNGIFPIAKMFVLPAVYLHVRSSHVDFNHENKRLNAVAAAAWSAVEVTLHALFVSSQSSGESYSLIYVEYTGIKLTMLAIYICRSKHFLLQLCSVKPRATVHNCQSYPHFKSGV